jgi:hypothetical protein
MKAKMTFEEFWETGEIVSYCSEGECPVCNDILTELKNTPFSELEEGEEAFLFVKPDITAVSKQVKLYLGSTAYDEMGTPHTITSMSGGDKRVTVSLGGPMTTLQGTSSDMLEYEDFPLSKDNYSGWMCLRLYYSGFEYTIEAYDCDLIASTLKDFTMFPKITTSSGSANYTTHHVQYPTHGPITRETKKPFDVKMMSPETAIAIRGYFPDPSDLQTLECIYEVGVAGCSADMTSIAPLIAGVELPRSVVIPAKVGGTSTAPSTDCWVEAVDQENIFTTITHSVLGDIVRGTPMMLIGGYAINTPDA